jgi:hypothetical protein
VPASSSARRRRRRAAALPLDLGLDGFTFNMPADGWELTPSPAGEVITKALTPANVGCERR